MSLLKGIAAFGIVGCHLNLHPLTEGAAFALGFCDMNVALFALISGWLMHVENWKDYVAKRMKRLVPIYAVWSVMYVILGLLFDVFVAKEMSPYLSNPWHWVNVVFRGESASQLWYLICLFYAQVLFACVCNRLSRTWWLVVGCGIVVLATVNNEFFCRYQLQLLGFLILGFALRTCLHFGRKGWWWACVIGMAWVHAGQRGVFHPFVRDLLLSVAILGAFCGGRGVSPRLVSFMALMGRTSLAVFLIHPAIAAIAGVVVRRMFSAPYSASVVIGEWTFVWALAFLFALAVNAVPCLSRWAR